MAYSGVGPGVGPAGPVGSIAVGVERLGGFGSESDYSLFRPVAT
jgi:hypothetical protein